MPTLEVSNLSRTFGTGRTTVQALRDVSMQVEDGEIVGLLGLNGAGKTTMLRVVSTLLLPTSGTVRVCGHDVVAEPRAARALLSVVFGGERGFYERRAGRENLRFFGTLSGLSRREADARARDALERVGLREAADRAVETYSKGMKQRLHLASGMLTTPRLLLLDEPTVGLDPLEAERLRESISALREGGTAILLTSHYLTDIERLAERVVILQRGRVTHDLPLEDLLKRAGAAAEVTVTSAEPLVPPEAESRDGVRLLETVPGPPWRVRFEVRAWNPQSLSALAALWPGGKVTDVHVRPLSLEHVFAELARGEDDGA